MVLGLDDHGTCRSCTEELSKCATTRELLKTRLEIMIPADKFEKLEEGTRAAGQRRRSIARQNEDEDSESLGRGDESPSHRVTFRV